MNYFELFEIPVQLSVNKSLLPARFFELSRRYHPDYFAGQGAEAQAEALEKTALLNKAYRTFQHPDETIRYVLQLKGLMEEEEKYELPPDFLMEVMEINEALMEAEEEETRKKISSAIDELAEQLYQPVAGIIEHYQEGITTTGELLQVKEYYYKKKYIDRIREQL
ncbi:MAG: Fe-S protein assembly co-chaperone HscB [Chitinophagaceae bacterium]